MGAKAYVKLVKSLADVAGRIQATEGRNADVEENDGEEASKAPASRETESGTKQEGGGEKTSPLRDEYANKHAQAERARADAEQMPGGNSPGALPALPSENPDEVDPKALQDDAERAQQAQQTQPEDKGRPLEPQSSKAAGVPASPAAAKPNSNDPQGQPKSDEDDQAPSDTQQSDTEDANRDADQRKNAQKQAQEQERSRKLREAKRNAKPGGQPGVPGELPGVPGGASGAGLTEGLPGVGAAGGTGAGAAGAAGAVEGGAGTVTRLALRNPYVIAVIAALAMILLLIVLILIPTFTAPIAACTVGADQIPEAMRPDCTTLVGK